jgi:ankyrin repeat protein
MAAQYGDLGLVSYLVERGATVDQGRTHLTPITLAARRRALAIVDFLRKKGATMSIVTWACLGNAEQVLGELERDPEQARIKDETGTPVLLHAAETLQAEIVKLLLERGVPVSETDANGETALHRVADVRRGCAEPASQVAGLLIDRGADVNARNWDDVTPLHQAVRARNIAVAELLLKRGADPNARDGSRGSTPLRRAVSASGAGGTAGTTGLMLPLTQLLLEYGADPDSCDKRGVPVYKSAKKPEIRALLDKYRSTTTGQPNKP